MTKFKASSIHLFCTIIIVSVVITLMLTLWYPNAYFKLMGGKELIFLIGAIDVFLGPLLTFVVYKPMKKTLKFDLACIALFQITALCYGLSVMFSARPVFTVFNKDSFYVASVVDIDSRELEKAKRWRDLSITGPKLVAIGIQDKNNKKEKTFAEVAGKNAYRYPRLYDDFENHTNEVIKAGRPLKELTNKSIDNMHKVNDLTENLKKPLEDLLFLPIVSNVENMTAVIDAKTGEIIKIIDIEI